MTTDTPPASDDLDAWIDEGGLPTGTVDVCLRGDLVAQVEDLDSQLRELRKNTDNATMAERGDARRLAEQIRALQEQMTASTRTFHLRALTFPDLQALIGKHAPRKDDQLDRALGFNRATFFPAIITACLVEPVLTAAQWAKLVPRLSAGQFEDLANKAWDLSKRRVDVPFSPAASATLSTSDETSKPQNA